MMTPVKPTKSLADYLIIGISPALIMVLVGSLCFFLIGVFFRSDAVGSVRWVMFWFVLAVVLVSRIGIEQGPTYAAVYGLSLAVATWLYLVRVHPAFILGALLLGIVWWCAHKLTWDCTLIDENEDASGAGLLQSVYNRKGFRWLPKKSVLSFPSSRDRPAKPEVPHPPGLWVVWFSLAALPLFGAGEMLLPGGNSAARHAGFVWLFTYMSAALGLLLTTSFLGLRRYLRQRYLSMPDLMALGWIRWGVVIGVLALGAALLLPRPGGTAAWQTLGYQINYQIHRASDYAARFGPHGSGPGKPGDKLDNSAPPKDLTAPSGQQKTPGQSAEKDAGNSSLSHDVSPPPVPSGANLFRWLRVLFLCGAIGLAAWWIVRNRGLLSGMLKALMEAIRQFFQSLFPSGAAADAASPAVSAARSEGRPFANFDDPFRVGYDAMWTPEEVVIYSYSALRAWAAENGIEPRPEQTAREFCAALADRYPEITTELNGLSFLYGYAAYGGTVPVGRSLDPVKDVWRFLRPQKPK